MNLTEVYHFVIFLLDEHHANLPCSALSFGHARLLLARLVAQGANFLVLDEPLTISTYLPESTEKALDAF